MPGPEAGTPEQNGLMIEGPGWYASPEVVILNRLPFLFLPPYYPWLQPAEKIWLLADRGFANRAFAGLDQLEAV